MTWSKFGDTFMEQESVELLSNDALALYFAIVLYAGRQDADGRVPRSIARRLRDVPDINLCIEELLTAGLIEELDATSYHLPLWTEHHLAKEKVDELRAATAKRQANYRAKQKERRENGYWKQSGSDAASSNGVIDGVTNDVTDAVSHSYPTRPDQTRPGNEGGTGMDGTGATPHPSPSPSKPIPSPSTPPIVLTGSDGKETVIGKLKVGRE